MVNDELRMQVQDWPAEVRRETGLTLAQVSELVDAEAFAMHVAR